MLEDMEEEDATSATPFDFKIKRAIFVKAEVTNPMLLLRASC